MVVGAICDALAQLLLHRHESHVLIKRSGVYGVHEPAVFAKGGYQDVILGRVAN